MEGLLRGARGLGAVAIGAGIFVEFFIYDGEIIDLLRFTSSRSSSYGIKE
jgi:hypothetical protein